MAQKVVGYREMMWTCPNCGAKNPGSSRTCKSCGAAMGEEVKFEQRTNAGLIRDAKIVEQAKRGPDIYCAYCGNRNPAGAVKCSRCGADLSEGKEREHGTQHSAHLDEQGEAKPIICAACGSENPPDALKCKTCGAPLGVTQEKEEIPPAPAAEPAPASNSGSGKTSVNGPTGCLKFILILIILGVLGMVLMYGCGSGGGGGNTSFFSGNDGGGYVYSTPIPNSVLSAVVSSQTWQTSVDVIGLISAKGSGWKDSIPSDAKNLKCEDRVRYVSDDEVANSKEVCGTPYAIDLGNGFEQFVQDCVYHVYDSYCEYTTAKEGIVDTATASGSGPNPEAPYVDSRYGTGKQSVSYTVTLWDENGKTYTFYPTTLSEYQMYTVGTEYEIEVNSRGRIVNMERK